MLQAPTTAASPAPDFSWTSELDVEDVLLAEAEMVESARNGLLPFTVFTHFDYRVNWHHRLIAAKFEAFVRGEIKRLIVAAPPRTGKALALNTPIPTPNGWTTMGALKPGDLVFDDRGLPCRVVAKSQVWRNRPCWRVITDDGDDSIVADGAHEWRVRLDRKHKALKVYDTEKLASRASARKPMVERHPGLRLPATTLPIAPYVLGVWLGDGASEQATITEGHQDITFIRGQVELEGYETSDRKTVDTFGILGLHRDLRALGLLGNKHIPDAYLRAGHTQRLALLQGLVDTDGYVDPRTGLIEFCTIREELAYQVQELVRSLGVKCSVRIGDATLNGRFISKKYRLFFMKADAARLPRRLALCRDGAKQPNTYLQFERCERMDTACIEVDSPSHLFLAGRSMTPTHNSEMISRRLPAFIFGRNPNARIIACSYNASLAAAMNRDVQRIMMTDEYRQVFPATCLNDKRVVSSDDSWKRSSEEFEIVNHRGYYKCAGVGGGITGRGADFILVDDPIKGRQEADSETVRSHLWEWFQDDLKTRLDGDGGIAILATRWHEDDLSGMLIKKMKEDPDADQWEVLSLPCRMDVPSLAHPEDPRKEGDILWPWFYCGKRDDLPEGEQHALAKEKVRLWEHNNARGFASLGQQDPAPRAGNMFDVEKIEIVHSPPAKRLRTVRYWDKAGTEGGGAFTAGVKMSLLEGGLYLIEHVRRGQWGAFNREKHIRDAAILDGKSVTILVEQEPGSGGLESAQNTVRNLAGYSVRLDKPSGDKELRADPFSSQVAAGNVYMLAGDWNQEYKEEMRFFPSSKYKDQIDASSGAFNFLVGRGSGWDALGKM